MDGLRIKWEKINFDFEPFYGDINLGNITMFRIFAWMTNYDNFLLGIEGYSSYRFKNKVHWKYVVEKLMLSNESDARIIADFINAQLGIQCEQQGFYYRDYITIKEESCYGFDGDRFLIPICPKIIE